MYFSYFPKGTYDLKGDGKEKLVTNLMSRVKIRSKVLDEVSLYDLYDIPEGETPEIIAEKFYKDATLHWVIMLVNNRYNMYNDFPLSYSELMLYVDKKYPGTQNQIKEYRLDGYVVDSTVIGAVGITNKEYEVEQNESKRRIKILKASYVDAVVRDFKKKLSE